jgi:hypothetical protein
MMFSRGMEWSAAAQNVQNILFAELLLALKNNHGFAHTCICSRNSGVWTTAVSGQQNPELKLYVSEMILDRH